MFLDARFCTPTVFSFGSVGAIVALLCAPGVLSLVPFYLRRFRYHLCSSGISCIVLNSSFLKSSSSSSRNSGLLFLSLFFFPSLPVDAGVNSSNTWVSKLFFVVNVRVLQSPFFIVGVVFTSWLALVLHNVSGRTRDGPEVGWRLFRGGPKRRLRLLPPSPPPSLPPNVRTPMFAVSLPGRRVLLSISCSIQSSTPLPSHPPPPYFFLCLFFFPSSCHFILQFIIPPNHMQHVYFLFRFFFLKIKSARMGDVSACVSVCVCTKN